MFGLERHGNSISTPAASRDPVLQTHLRFDYNYKTKSLSCSKPQSWLQQWYETNTHLLCLQNLEIQSN